MKLVNLVKKCLQLEISKPEMKDMEAGFVKWVEEYERCVPISFFSVLLCSFSA
jgi:hypothetical protein